MMKINLRNIGILLIGSATVGLGLSYGNLYLFHVVLAMSFVVSLLKYNDLKTWFYNSYNNKLFWFPAFILVWFVSSVLWSFDGQRAANYSVYWLFALLIILSFSFFIRNLDDQKSLIKVLGIIFAIEILISFLEAFTPIRYPISPYSDLVRYFGRGIGYNPNLPDEVIDLIKRTPTGFRWNPNDLATTMLIIMPYFLFHKRSYIKFIGSVSSIIVISLTGSRAAIAALVISLVASMFIYLKPIYWLRISSVFAVVIVGSIFVLNSSNINLPPRFNNIKTTFAAAKIFISEDHEQVNDSSSISIRQNLMENGIKGLKRSKGLGVGGGNSNRLHEIEGSSYTHGVTSMHNFWFEVLVEGGVVIFIVLLYWYFWIFIKLLRVSRLSTNDTIVYYSKSGSMAMISFAFGVITMSSAVYFLPLWIMMGLNINTIVLAEKEVIS